MTHSNRLWIFNEEITFSSNVNEVITKVANIDNYLFILTRNNKLFKGEIEISTDGHKFANLQFVNNFKLLDIDSFKENLYIIDTDGNVFITNDQLEILCEISFIEESKCPRGHDRFKNKVKIKSLAVGEYGKLFISEDNQLWGSGYMPQVEINSDTPKKIIFFSEKAIHGISIGSDFAVVLVSNINKLEDSEVLEEISTFNCPNCNSASQRTSPDSQTSLGDICPLGVKLKNSSSVEDLQISGEHQNSTDLDQIKLQELEKPVEKNIIFRNTEAAKEFLSRQISRMSSVGEEYLIECTEKPTRLIKENVSNMATLVYEGVKTVGDKVATLSRHVSTGSDCNSTLENNNQYFENKKICKEEVFYGSQSTSEKDFSEVEMQDHLDNIVNRGAGLLNHEVWTWGNIFHGIGEAKQNTPVIISVLSNIGICKVSLQNHHACALTLDGRAFIWGQNNYHQVTIENNVDQISPKMFLCNMNERVRDAVCGSHFTVILTSRSNVIYFGKGTESYQNIFNIFMTENNSDETLAVELYKNLLSTKHCSLLRLGAKYEEHFSKFLFKEQTMLEEMLCVYQHLIKNFLKKTSDLINAVFEPLCKAYSDLLYYLSISIESLSEYRNGLIYQNDIVLIKYYKEHISLYKCYVDVIQNIVSVNGFESISKSITISSNLYKLKSGVLKEKNTEEKDLSLILLSPVKRMYIYTDFFRRYSTTDIQSKWKDFLDYAATRAKEAEKTNAFWLNTGKNINYLMTPERRLICDSQLDPISLQNASRFFSHRFVLFSDIFAHINGSSCHLHNLAMIWLELPHHDDLHLISLNMPEDSLILVAPDGEFKNKWYHALQQSIKIVLNKVDFHHPPMVRSGTYTFSKSGFLKDATFTGRWLNAKMHGNGKLKWSDGKLYTGQFSNSVLNGYGTMEIPNLGIYEGWWKDNKQNGYGTFTYHNKDIYKGYFKEGTPHGHGFLRKGNLMAKTAAFYVGEWVSGQKCGYGVMDDISTGQKYLGSWVDNKKEGNGLMITSDGAYYEGNFHNDLLLGHGAMIMEDGSYYEGEFKGIGIIGGKGTLTLPSGHVLEGNLCGSMETGIKINSGVLSKKYEDNISQPKSFGKLCTPPSQKWNAIFKHCYEIMGLPESSTANGISNSLETSRIWQNVAIYLANASTLKRAKGDEHTFQNSLNNLDVIPPFGRDKLTMESYLEITNYLNRAFDSNFHPLGVLLKNLSEAYIASYGGKIHPILVNHAILEIIDLTQRVYEIIRYLFPALPASGYECMIHNKNSDEIISYQLLLYPIILPKVYYCLFTLLTLKNNVQEVQYKKALKEWNKLPDRSLMNVLSVNEKFFDLDSSTKNSAFLEAIETLQQIKSMFLPIEKLTVIRNTVEKMTPVAQNLLGDGYVWNMDDLFPLFLYVVVRARIPDLGAELEFIENFMDSTIENGELDIMFTTLKACYQQILQDKSIYF